MTTSTTPMSWDGYVSAWAGTHQGYDPRHAGPVTRGWARMIYRAGGALVRAGVGPGQALFVAVVCAVAVPLLCSVGRPLLGLLLLAAGAVSSALYETIPLLRRRVTGLEMLYRTLADRFSEVCWLVALMILGAHPALALLCGVLMWLHEYVRAQAGAVGLRAAGSATVGDRSSRVWLTVAALILAGLSDQVGASLAAGVVTLVLAAWLLLALIGFVQLLTIARKALA